MYETSRVRLNSKNENLLINFPVFVKVFFEIYIKKIILFSSIYSFMFSHILYPKNICTISQTLLKIRKSVLITATSAPNKHLTSQMQIIVIIKLLEISTIANIGI